MIVPDDGVRRAEPGELCACGRQAQSVVSQLDTGALVGVCNRDNGGVPAGGVCVFCSNELTHDRPRVSVVDGFTVVGVFRQGEVCPRYRLRLSDPVPEGAP